MPKMNFPAAMLLVSVSGAAFAAPVSPPPTLVGTTTNASGIDGVVVGNFVYDVSFSTSSFDSPFTDNSTAGPASVALAMDLSNLLVTGLSYGGASGFDCTAEDVIECGIFAGSTNLVGNTVLAGALFLLPPGERSPPWLGNQALPELPGCPQRGSSICVEAAHWTVVGRAPEPATFGLLGLGLAGLGLARLKRQS